jgi:hypothetical protein
MQTPPKLPEQTPLPQIPWPTILGWIQREGMFTVRFVAGMIFAGVTIDGVVENHPIEWVAGMMGIGLVDIAMSLSRIR